MRRQWVCLRDDLGQLRERIGGENLIFFPLP